MWFLFMLSFEIYGVRILIMLIMIFLDGLNLYIYAMVYNVGYGITVYDFVKSTSINIYKAWTIKGFDLLGLLISFKIILS